MITYGDFEKLDVQVGKIVKVEDFKNAKNSAYKLWIDFGESGVKRSSAQITEHYTRWELQGRYVLAVMNLQAKQIADFLSEVLVLGVPDAQGHVVLLGPDFDVPLGSRMF